MSNKCDCNGMCLSEETGSTGVQRAVLIVHENTVYHAERTQGTRNNINLKTAVGSRKSAQSLAAHRELEKESF